jgi:uncharacterized Zn finger protein
MPEPDRIVVLSPSGRESVQVKARRLLAEGRVTITSRVPGRAEARVRGTEEVHRVSWERGLGWACSCPAFPRRCSHRVALSLVILPDTAEGWRTP